MIGHPMLTPRDLARLGRGIALSRMSFYLAASLSPRLAMSKILEASLRRRGSSLRLSARTFWGDTLAVALPEGVSTYLFRYGFFEANLTAAIVSLLHPGMVFVDVGAHLGYYSRLAARLVGSEGRVLAVEPGQAVLPLLRRNCADFPTIDIVEAAAYDRDASVRFHDFGLGSSAYSSISDPRADASSLTSAAMENYLVPGVSLDSYLSSRDITPDFIKIDAEGSEPQVVEGLEKTLAKRHAVLSIEVGDYGADSVGYSRGLISLLSGYRYRAFDFIDGRFRPHAERERYAYDNLLFFP